MEQAVRKKIVVVYADIRGSSRWTRRVGDDEETRLAFMAAYDREALFYRKRTAAHIFKRLGDGRMFVHELARGQESATAATVLVEALGFLRRVERLISRLHSPRPAGIRLRAMSGMVYEDTYPDAEVDVNGYVPNTCHKFLGVAPEIGCVVHESVKELIRPKCARASGFVFTLVKGLRRCPDGVDREDVDALWAVTRRPLLRLIQSKIPPAP
jgi:class 3 adenylate cyclase